MKAKKLMVLVMALACVATISITATLAYFTDTTDAVVNTFTVGKVEITMDEANVDGKDAEGNDNSDEERDLANDYYLVPSHTYVKDPTVYVDKDSEACFLFVTVANGIALIETTEEGKTIAEQMDTLGWDVVDASKNLYCYCDADGKPKSVAAGADVVVFNEFTIEGTVDNTTLGRFGDAEIVVNAYAVQSAGLETKTAAEVWTASGFSL